VRSHINKIPMFSLNLVYYLLDIEYAGRKNMAKEAYVNEITKTWSKRHMLMK